ncbi:MAG: hypothetical protein C5S40_01680 [ANME-2 cluster archaeon]|nr:hypothetical protein [ANME-2 cluster archaeon]
MKREYKICIVVYKPYKTINITETFNIHCDKMSVILDKNACDKSPYCMMVSLFPTGAISVKESEYPVFNAQTCEDCRQCVSACPHQALSLA